MMFHRESYADAAYCNHVLFVILPTSVEFCTVIGTVIICCRNYRTLIDFPPSPAKHTEACGLESHLGSCSCVPLPRFYRSARRGRFGFGQMIVQGLLEKLRRFGMFWVGHRP